MKNFFASVALLTACCSANAGIVKSLALDRLADLEKIIALDSKTLAEMRKSTANQTLLVRDQNVRYLTLIEKSKSTFGDDPLSAQGACVKALSSAHELWQAKVAYERSRSNFDKDTLSRWQQMYSSEYKACRAYVGGLR